MTTINGVQFTDGPPPEDAFCVFLVKAWGLILVYWDAHGMAFKRLDDQCSIVHPGNITAFALVERYDLPTRLSVRPYGCDAKGTFGEGTA